MDQRPLTPSWDEIAELFSCAVEMPTGERGSWLDRVCAGRSDLRGEIESMLQAHEQPEARLEIEEQLLAEPDATLAEGTTLGRYRTKRFLGRGGMGEVYLAERTGADYAQLVAIKILRLRIAGAATAARFRRERRILANLNHPAVVPLLDSGVAPDGRPYIVLQYVDGQPITLYCDEKKLPLEARLKLFVDVCRAVQYAHARLIIHRDLKPTNILVTSDGEPRLLDFGIAKALDPEEQETELTRNEPAPMTPERAAPEQLRGETPSTATDVWALGVLLYELVTGRLPFNIVGKQRAEIAKAVTTRERVGRLRGDLDTVISVALRPEPERRYASAAQLADDVERVLTGQPILARPQSLGYLVRRFVSRNRAAVTASALALASVFAFSIVSIIQSREVMRERDRATAEQVKANAVVDLLAQILEGADPTVGASSPTIDVNELLARGEERARALADQPATQARLFHVLGKVQLTRSGFPKAKELIASAYAAQVAIGGSTDPRALEMAFDLARADAQLGRRSAAKTRLRAVISALEKQDRTNPELLANALDELSDLSDRSEATKLIQRALTLRRALNPPRPVQVAKSLSQLGVLAWHDGDREAAARHFRDALVIMERERGPDHPHTLSVKSDLATAVANAAEREAHFRSLIAAQTRRMGDPSVEVAIAWNNFGNALAESGDFNGAMAALEEARKRWIRLGGDDHPQTLNTRRSIAALLGLSGRSEESLTNMRDILVRARRGGINPATEASLRAQTAGVLFHLGHRDEAKRELEAVLAELRRLEPEGAPNRTSAQFAVGIVLLAEGKGRQAEEELRAVLAAREKTFPAGHPNLAEVRVAIGRALVAQGRLVEGRSLIRENLPVYERYAFAHPNDVSAARLALR